MRGLPLKMTRSFSRNDIPQVVIRIRRRVHVKKISHYKEIAYKSFLFVPKTEYQKLFIEYAQFREQTQTLEDMYLSELKKRDELITELTQALTKQTATEKDMRSLIHEIYAPLVQYQTFKLTEAQPIETTIIEVLDQIDVAIAGINLAEEQFSMLLEKLLESKKQLSEGIAKDEAVTQKINVSTNMLTEITKRSEVLAGQVTDLETLIKQTNEISERLNLIVLNGKIEAAHAGTFGKGFAVVNNEIEKLNKRISSELLPDQKKFIMEKLVPVLTDISEKLLALKTEMSTNTLTLTDVSHILSAITQTMAIPIDGINENRNSNKNFIAYLNNIRENVNGFARKLEKLKSIPDVIISEEKFSSIGLNEERIDFSAIIAQRTGNVMEMKAKMLERLDPFTWHQGKNYKILRFNFENFEIGRKGDKENFLEYLATAQGFYKTHPDKDIHVLTNVTNAMNPLEIFTQFIELRKLGVGRIKKSAIIGATGSRLNQVEALNNLSDKSNSFQHCR